MAEAVAANRRHRRRDAEGFEARTVPKGNFLDPREAARESEDDLVHEGAALKRTDAEYFD
jgi:hypothetical protein